MLFTQSDRQLGPRQRAFVDALRSGKYEQDYGNMRQSVPEGCSYCAMGVLIDVSNLGVWEQRGGLFSDYSYHFFVTKINWDLRTPAMHPAIVVHYALKPDVHERFVHLNDLLKLHFSAIADTIEEDPTQFFSDIV